MKNNININATARCQRENLPTPNFRVRVNEIRKLHIIGDRILFENYVSFVTLCFTYTVITYTGNSAPFL